MFYHIIHIPTGNVMTIASSVIKKDYQGEFLSEQEAEDRLWYSLNLQPVGNSREEFLIVEREESLKSIYFDI